MARTIMFAFEFQLYGLKVVFLPSLAMEHGPSSNNRPVELEQPGPPFNQRTTGSVEGELRDSKNLNRVSKRIPLLPGNLPEEQVLLLGDVEIARILLHRWIAESARLSNPKSVLLEGWMGDKLVCAGDKFGKLPSTESTYKEDRSS